MSNRNYKTDAEKQALAKAATLVRLVDAGHILNDESPFIAELRALLEQSSHLTPQERIFKTN